MTVWLALDPSNRRNGCMRVVPRTHRVFLARGTDRAGNEYANP